MKQSRMVSLLRDGLANQPHVDTTPATESLRDAIRATLSTGLEDKDSSPKEIKDKMWETVEDYIDTKIKGLPRSWTAPLVGVKYPGIVITKVDNNGEVDFVIETPKMKTNTLTQKDDVEFVLKHLRCVLEIRAQLIEASSGMYSLHFDGSEEETKLYHLLEQHTTFADGDYVYTASSNLGVSIYNTVEILEEHAKALMKLLLASTTTEKPSNESVAGLAGLALASVVAFGLAKATGGLIKLAGAGISKAMEKAFPPKVVQRIKSFEEQMEDDIESFNSRYPTKRDTVEGAWVAWLAFDSQFQTISPIKSIVECSKGLTKIETAIKAVRKNIEKTVDIYDGIMKFTATSISKLPADIKASLEDLASPQDRWYQWVGDELTKMHQKYSKQLPRPQPNLTPMLGGKGPSRIDTIPADKIEGVVKHLLEAVELYYEQFEFADLKEWSFEIDVGDFRPFWDNATVADPMNKLVDEFYCDELGPKYNLINSHSNKFEQYLRAVCALVKSSTKQPTGNESFTAVEAGLVVIGGLAAGSVFWSNVKKWLNLEKKEATKSNAPTSTYKTLADTVEELKGRVALDQTTQINFNEALLYNGKWDPVVTLPDFLQSFPKYLKYEQSVAKVVQGLLNELESGKFDTEWRKRYEVAFGNEALDTSGLDVQALVGVERHFEFDINKDRFRDITKLTELKSEVGTIGLGLDALADTLETEVKDYSTLETARLILNQHNAKLGVRPVYTTNKLLEEVKSTRDLVTTTLENIQTKYDQLVSQ